MSSPHALILPYPAQGHVIPLMELSYCLIQRGFRITFINTEFNHKRIFAGSVLHQAEFIDGIHFVTIPDGLEPEEDRHNFGRLTESLTTMMPKFFEEFMRNNAVEFTCFIADIFMAWAFNIAKKVGLRTAAFCPAAAGLLAAVLSIPKLTQDKVIDENAFGSTTIFNNKQFQELALGLELIGRPFLWVVRPDMTNKSINCTYPFGFKERVVNRGRMVGWSPQQEVLKHPAIACFISHCGWNSTIEAVRNGVPFLCWPYFGDQLFNQRYITKVWKVGLSFVPDENGLISKEEIGSKVQDLLKDREILARSQALKNFSDISVMKGGSSYENLNKFANFIRKN